MSEEIAVLNRTHTRNFIFLHNPAKPKEEKVPSVVFGLIGVLSMPF